MVEITAARRKPFRYLVYLLLMIFIFLVALLLNMQLFDVLSTTSIKEKVKSIIPFISNDLSQFSTINEADPLSRIFAHKSHSKKRVEDITLNNYNNLVAIYRLIGNDMPPLQSSGQLLRNTLYALQYEPQLPGAVKKWVLNRIWNDTMFHLLYDSLVAHGVSTSDILVRCFQVEEYNRMRSYQDRLLYLTSQNEARNEAIRDAKFAGYSWSVILDGNTFVTSDAWQFIRDALRRATKMRMPYMKIPYHRLHEPQSPQWLHEATSVAEVLRRAPTKGESQVAFHLTAQESFSLGNTRPDGKRGRKKGYGQRNKSYLFKDGQLCARDSKACMCADVDEGNEEDLAGKPAATNSSSYVGRCGLVLRLWSYPTEGVVDTGLPADEEKGFYCFLERFRASVAAKSECGLLQKALTKWVLMPPDKKRTLLLNSRSTSTSCKARYSRGVLTQSCLRAAARDRAVRVADQSIQLLWSFQQAGAAGGQGNTTCSRLLVLRSPVAGLLPLTRPAAESPPLMMFRAAFLQDSKEAWMKLRDRQRSGQDGVEELASSRAVERLLAAAEEIGRSIAAGQQSRDPVGDAIATALGRFFSGQESEARSAAALLAQLWSRCDMQCLLDAAAPERSARALHLFDALAMLAASETRGDQRLHSLFTGLRFPDPDSVRRESSPSHGPGAGQGGQGRGRDAAAAEKSWVFPHMKYLAVAAVHLSDGQVDAAALLQPLVLQLVKPYPAGYFHEDGLVPGLDYAQGEALLAAAEAVSCWLDAAQFVEAVLREAEPCAVASWWSATHAHADQDPLQATAPRNLNAPVLLKAVQRVLAAFAAAQRSRDAAADDPAARFVFSRLALVAQQMYNCSLPAAVSKTEPWSYFALGSMVKPRECRASDPATRNAFDLRHIAAEMQRRDAKLRKQTLTMLRAPKKISTSLFPYATERPDVALYRVLGNELSPLQSPEQVLRNIRFIVRSEAFFEGVEKKWILYRIWNQTILNSALQALVEGGVPLANILVECFDPAAWAGLRSPADKGAYLYSRHKPRDLALMDGLRSGRGLGREWVLTLDANTFIPTESWLDMRQALTAAQTDGLRWVKIPQHGASEEQGEGEDSSWLHRDDHTARLLSKVIVKGASDVAFHKRVLADYRTVPSPSSSSPPAPLSPEEGLYLAGEQACFGSSDRRCKCSQYSEHYELRPRPETKDFAYAKACGLTVRLRSRDPAQWRELLAAQLSRRLGARVDGFFCFLERTRGKARSMFPTECAFFSAAASKWTALNQSVRQHFSLLSSRGASSSTACRSSYLRLAAAAPCYEAQLKTALIAEEVGRKEAFLAQLSAAHLARWKQAVCPLGGVRTQSLGASDLVAFHEASLAEERRVWQQPATWSERSDFAAFAADFLRKANRGLSQGPFSVTNKLQSAPDGKRFYYSFRPYLWPYVLLPRSLQKKVATGVLKLDPPCCLHRDGHRVPGTVIGGRGENHFDRSSAWYMVDNVTTLALAWYFTRDSRYARHGAHLVDVYFLNESTSMLPSLQYAQNGYKYGLIDWKDLYYFLDAVTLLHRSGELSDEKRTAMQRWCSHMGHWILQSDMGHDEARALNNHGLYLDVTMLSLFIFAREEDFFVHTARNRLLFRLANEHPIGHFDADGGQPHESGRPTGLHYITFNLVGWIHAALICEAVRMRSSAPAAELSLWLVKHDSEASNPAAQPVLCKAIRYLSTYLPARAGQYEQHTQPAEDGMTVFWPYEQADAFAFDRMLEIIRYGRAVYGLEALFPAGEVPQNVRTALDYPLYSTRTATHTKYSSVHPDSGNRAWPSLGLRNVSKPIPYMFR